jgi:quercetin dioxygenase-like cupin family protein
LRLDGLVKKGWGHEYIFATNDKYCGKLLKFNAGGTFSMHFHDQKDETWLVIEGEFLVKYINTLNADLNEIVLKEGDTWRNEPLEPHQVICLKEGTIIEVSTPDSVEDNYRVWPGDSQSSKNDQEVSK